MRKGFTLVELLIAVAVLVIVTAASFIGVSNYRSSQNLKDSVNEVAAVIRATQSRSVTQENGKQWSIRLTNATSGKDFYQTFSGASYATSAVDRTYYLRSGIQFGEPGKGLSADEVFSAITGNLSSNKITSLVTGREDGLVGDIILHSQGPLTTRQENGLVGYWHLDEGFATTTYDASGMGNVGTASGTAWISGTNCKAGACLGFDGTDDYVRNSSFTGQPTSNEPRTITAWVRPNAGYTGNNVIVFFGQDSGLPYGYGVYLNSAYKLVAEFDSSNGIVTGSQVLASNMWSYIAAVYNGSTNAVYVNGVLDNSVSYSSANAQSGEVDIGQWSTGCCRFSGRIDEVRIYDRALSATEIQNLYNDLK